MLPRDVVMLFQPPRKKDVPFGNDALIPQKLLNQYQNEKYNPGRVIPVGVPGQSLVGCRAVTIIAGA
jgi:hypothetical protein